MKRLNSPFVLGMFALICISGANAADYTAAKDSGKTAVRMDPVSDAPKPDVSSQKLDTNKVNTARPQVKSSERDVNKFPGDQFNKFPGDQFDPK